ncbi:MAG: hypothetical protein ACRCW4_07125 [Candidatus Neomicrothrix subdominans]|jgi:uncharacterized protein with PQ loop repeat|nr:hypothetical protein [Candidatus Microthrix sp.]MBK6438667.1 hypothetical protein [Candidatus Microthrix sp.]MBK6968974.1 hypothetical protein [Candidatus Microthrix sp.]
MSPIVLSSMLVVANIMGAGMIVPQVVRLRRYRNTRGISASWIGVGLAMNLWWVAYGLASGLWGIIPVSAVAFLLYLVMTAQYAGINGTASLRGCATGMVGVGIVPLPALILDGWATAGVVVGLCYAVQFAPAALTALRSDRLDGVSPITWAMAGTEAAVWLVYGVNQGDAALVVGGGGGLTMSLVILIRLARLSTRQPTVVDTDAELLTLVP